MTDMSDGEVVATGHAHDVAAIIIEQPDPTKAVDMLLEEFPYLSMEFISVVATGVEPELRRQGLGDLTAFRRELANRWPNYRPTQSYLKS